jgi:hypothetical protein|tara:strand:- start:1059 stop:1205 length:147 start_codon:yes stop_codon:yes gene_type:complete
MKYLFILLLVVGCTNKTFVLPAVETLEEERYVLTAVPVIPVEIEILEQ